MRNFPYTSVIIRSINLALLFCIGSAALISVSEAAQHYNYAVVIREGAYNETGWRTVADSLVRKHNIPGTARLFVWSSSLNDIREDLSAFKPDYIGFVARPVTDCNAAFIVSVSRFSRSLSGDPYGDAVWGIITGYEAADALRAISESLTVKTVLAASSNLSYEPPIQRFYQAIGMTCDSYTKTDYLFADRSGRVYTEDRRPNNDPDRIKIVSEWLNAESLNIEIPGQGTISGPVDCIITGGHGNVNAWQCHYPNAGTEGFMRSTGGNLFGAPFSGSNIAISAPTPKIYWFASNCLMGNPNNRNNMVYAAFRSGRAVQLFGFVNNASAGNEFMAWGVYDRVTKFAGKHTLAQAFFLSNNNAMFELEHPTGQINSSRVRMFMDSTVFYGDPAADVRFHDFGDTAKAYLESLTYTENGSGSADFSYTVTMVAHDLEFGIGYCYQFRPISLLPVRIDPQTVEITSNDGHTAVITDNLLIWEMLARGERLQKGRSKTLNWTATITDHKTGTVREAKNTHATQRDEGFTVLREGTELIIRNNLVLEKEITLRFFDISGKLRFTRRISSGSSSIYRVALPALSLSSGLLLMVVEQNGVKVHQNVVIAR